MPQKKTDETWFQNPPFRFDKHSGLVGVTRCHPGIKVVKKMNVTGFLKNSFPPTYKTLEHGEVLAGFTQTPALLRI